MCSLRSYKRRSLSVIALIKQPNHSQLWCKESITPLRQLKLTTLSSCAIQSLSIACTFYSFSFPVHVYPFKRKSAIKASVSVLLASKGGLSTTPLSVQNDVTDPEGSASNSWCSQQTNWQSRSQCDILVSPLATSELKYIAAKHTVWPLKRQHSHNRHPIDGLLDSFAALRLYLFFIHYLSFSSSILLLLTNNFDT